MKKGEILFIWGSCKGLRIQSHWTGLEHVLNPEPSYWPNGWGFDEQGQVQAHLNHRAKGEFKEDQGTVTRRSANKDCRHPLYSKCSAGSPQLLQGPGPSLPQRLFGNQPAHCDPWTPTMLAFWSTPIPSRKGPWRERPRLMQLLVFFLFVPRTVLWTTDA